MNKRWPKVLQQLLDKGMSVSGIAKECNCSQSVISLLLSGKRNDTSYTIGKQIERLAEMVGVEVEV